MNRFLINGNEKPNPLQPDQAFAELINYIQKNLVNENNLVSSIKINGVVMEDADGVALAKVPISDIDTVEVNFASPHEIAEQTLQMLRGFSDELISLSRNAAQEPDPRLAEGDFRKLVDGIQTFAEVVTTVKTVLRVGFLQAVSILEVDLLDILQDLLEAQKTGDKLYRQDLLAEHLPRNLIDWQNDGIPALLRARDS